MGRVMRITLKNMRCPTIVRVDLEVLEAKHLRQVGMSGSAEELNRLVCRLKHPSCRGKALILDDFGLEVSWS